MLIDNKHDYLSMQGLPSAGIKSVADFLCKYTGAQSGRHGALDLVTGYFTIAGLGVLYKEFHPENRYRLILSALTGDDDFMDRVIDLLQGDAGIESTLKLTQAAQDAIAFLRRETVEVKAITKAFCHAKAYIYADAEDETHDYYVMGSSNLTEAGLGLRETSNVELNFAQTGNTNAEYQQLRAWFKQQWEKVAEAEIPSEPDDPQSKRPGKLIGVKEYFIDRIMECFGRTHTPEEIYYKILYELFHGDLDLEGGLASEKEMTLLQDSTIYRTLFDYQKKGVISLIKMLRKWNGAILADAVGLGKTFSALAVMKYFQNNGYQVLMLCPKKLEQNWKQYRRRRGSRFERDEFDYIVRFHTDLQDDRMDRGDEVKLAWLKKQQKLLVVIDESHNLRNDKSSRYQLLMKELLANDAAEKVRDVKVLLLSATPINNGLTDIRNQFKLIAHGDNAAFNTDDFQIANLESLFADANKQFKIWCDKPNRTLGGFIEKLPPHFFDLTDKLIVARTRNMIEKTLGEDLGFPKKAKPDNQYVGIGSIGAYQTIADVYDAMLKSNLTAYQPTQYMSAKDGKGRNWQDNTFRERFLVKMMSVLFMKRLESSWISCLKTVAKVRDVHQQTLDKVDAFLAKRGTASLTVDVPDAEEDSVEAEEFSLRNNTINLAEMERIHEFRNDLAADVAELREFCANLETFRAQFEAGTVRDVKLDRLVEILAAKQGKANRKAIVFTTFGDTAQYLYDEITKRHPEWRVACVTGQQQLVSQECDSSYERDRFLSSLQRFAPRAKLYNEKDWSDLYADACERGLLDRGTAYDAEKRKWNVDYEKWRKLVAELDPDCAQMLNAEIDILIATDCLSEGQNLQDADLVVNYDIHWNPVRLIQRFGRIDRIGSPNKVVQAVNFWPAGSYDEVLKLAGRINNKMALMELAGTETIDVSDRLKTILKDSPLVDHNTQKLLEQIKDGNIDDIEQNAVEGNGSGGLGLQDFSLEVFRQDLLDFLEKNRDNFRKMPAGVFSGFKLEPSLFTQVPESLVAVLGYPRRKPDETKKPYERIFLMLQPAGDAPAEWQELSVGAVLNFLRQNKGAKTNLPDWVLRGDAAMIQKMSNIIRNWLTGTKPVEVKKTLLSLFTGQSQPRKHAPTADDIFKFENFDLIAWEYVSR